MEFSERILQCFEERNVKPSEVSRATGIDKSTFTKWKSNPTSKLDLENAYKIASYLHVSLDYLVGRETNSENGLNNPLENEMMYFFRRLSDADKRNIVSYEKYICSNYRAEAKETV